MAQKTDVQLKNQSLVIRNETVEGGNTRQRHDDMNQDIIDSKLNNDKVDTAGTLDTAEKTVPGRDAVKTYIAAQKASQANVNTGSNDVLFLTSSKLKNKDGDVTALVDGAIVDITSDKCSLATAAAAREFTFGHTGDDIIVEVTLNAVISTFTFPIAALCITEGIASGDNTAILNGVSGDRYIMAIKKINANYYVVIKNFRQ